MKKREQEAFRPFIEAWARDRVDLTGGATETKALYADWLQWCEARKRSGQSVPFITQNSFVRLLQRLFDVFTSVFSNRYCLNGMSLHTGAGQVVEERRKAAEAATAAATAITAMNTSGVAEASGF